ncbi:MAG: hypothetical protein EPO65_12420 [Dehalococcoidia bacterium]|nr:MAG: hypothetical protein EPO65_12420 [Dehalococcoidia bacterium]
MPEDVTPTASSLAEAMPLLIAGMLTLDRFADETPVRESPGGAVLFAARTAEAFGIRPLVLTKVNREPLLFEHTHVDGERRLRLEHPPRSPIGAIDVPNGWPEPRTILLCPLIAGDLDVASFLDRWPGTRVGLLAQGMQRRRLDDGSVRVVGAPSPALLGAARPGVTIFLAQDEVARWSEGALTRLASRCERVVVTRGADGARVINTDGSEARIEAVAAQPIDTTGAGDVFAAAFILGLRAGLMVAGRLAAAAAACEVETLGPAPLPPLAQIAARAGVAL